MKTIFQIGFLLSVGGLFATGMLYENVYLIAIALSSAYLCVTVMRSRFHDTRKAMFTGASQSSGMKLDDRSLFFPFSNEKGVYVLKSEEELPVVSVGDIQLQVKKLVPYPVTNGVVKNFEIEGKYLQYIFVCRMALRFTTFLAFVLAGYYMYTADKYSFLLIPIAMVVYHFIVYYQVFASAKEIQYADYVNADREYLQELMRFYGVSVVGLENPEPLTEVMPTGAVLVRFDGAKDAPYYYLTFEERVHLEHTAERLIDVMQKEKELLSL